MKRAARNQLTRDAGDSDEEDGMADTGEGFKKADEASLSSRPIKGLPRRSMASSTPPPASPALDPPPPGKFSGFGGFGSGASSTTPFSFSAPSVPPSAPFGGTSSLGGSSFTTPPQSTFGASSVAPSASSATKAFASIVSSSSATDSTPKADAEIQNEDQEIQLLKALRGLNVSFLSAVSKAIESDPFVDVADLLERYKTLRSSVSTEFDSKSAPKPAASFGSAAPKPSPFVPGDKSTSTAAPSFSLPAPPAAFAGFKPLSSAPTSSSTSSEFTAKSEGAPAPLGAPFSFGTSKPEAKSATPPEPPKSTFSFGATSTPAPSSSLFGGSSSSASSLFSKPAPTPGPTTSLFGSNGSASGPSSSMFGSGGGSSAFGGGSNIFGKPAAKDSTEGDADRKTDDPKPAPSSSFFGGGGSSSSSFSFGAPPADKSAPASGSSTPFSFGSGSPTKASVFGSGFGKPAAGSIGNPVGFGFGSPPKTPDPDGPIKSLPFSFGAPPKPAESTATATPEAHSDASTPAPEEAGAGGDGAPAQTSGLLSSTSVHDLEGEGEENEVTTHFIRSKVYKMVKSKEGKAEWGDMGVGVLRLKKHKETEARRLLLRNSSTGKITVNFSIHQGMSPSVTDKTVSFMGHDDGVSTPYRIRTKTPVQANELKAALDREIEFVKGKGEA